MNMLLTIVTVAGPALNYYILAAGRRAFFIKRNEEVPCVLTEAPLVSEILLRLRIADLNVLTEAEWEKTSGKPFLYVNILDTGIPGTKGEKLGVSFPPIWI
jgi:hypothetical protein